MMQTNTKYMRSQDDLIVAEKTLFDVLFDVWAARFYMLTFAGLGVIVAAIFLWSAKPYYRAQLLIAPAQSIEVEAIHKRSQEGAISAQPYMLLGDQNFIHLENIITGQQISKLLANEDKLIQLLERDTYFKFSQKDKTLSVNQLADYLVQRVKIEAIYGTDLRRLVYYHPDTESAQYLLQRLYEIADMIIKAQRLRDLNERISYLTDALERSQNVEHRHALTTLLLEQERKRMLAMQNTSYAARIIEPVSVSSSPKWPDKYLIITLSILLGCFIGFVVYGVRDAKRNPSN